MCVDETLCWFCALHESFANFSSLLLQFLGICVPWMQSSNAKQPHRKFIISYNSVRQTQKMFIFRWPKPKCNSNIQTRAQTHTNSLSVRHTGESVETLPVLFVELITLSWAFLFALFFCSKFLTFAQKNLHSNTHISTDERCTCGGGDS